MDVSFRREVRQQHSLTPRLQRAVRLLQLSSLDFAREVQELMNNNPFLESSDGESDDDGSAAAAANAQKPDVPEVPEESPSSVEMPETDLIAHVDKDAPEHEADTGDAGDAWTMETGSSSRRNDEHEGSFADMLTHEASLQEFLHRQLNLLNLSERDRILASAVVDSLDDDGYLRIPLRELATIAELDPPAGEDEVRIALRRVQALEPAGVGARNVGECLQLQILAAPDLTEEQRDLLVRIVSGHLSDLAVRDFARLAEALDCDRGEIEWAWTRIRRLKPRPGWDHSASSSRYITPDVIVRKVRGAMMASLNPAIIPKVRMNRVYAELFRRHREARHAEMAAHLQEAKWTMRTVEQRFATILSVAEAIIRRQSQFFEYGPMAMKPLGLREIATELGLHESTVSRVTNNKFMSTPMGVYELKYFFSRGMKTANGGSCSPTAIRGLVKDMIEGEKSTDRLSDAEIARRLARQGLVVARRTVTKYRQSLRLETAELRSRQPT